MGQKRTFQAVTDRYAFLPREAVTKFLMSCRHCSRRMRTKNRFNVDSSLYLRKSSSMFCTDPVTAIQSKEANVVGVTNHNIRSKRNKQKKHPSDNRNNTDSSTATPVSSLGSNSPTPSLSDHCHLSDGSAIMIDRPLIRIRKTSSISPSYQHQQQHHHHHQHHHQQQQHNHHNRYYDDSSPMSDSYRALMASWNGSNRNDNKKNHHELNKLNSYTNNSIHAKEDSDERRLASADKQQRSHVINQQTNVWYNHPASEKRSESSNRIADINKEPVLDLSGVSHREATANQLVSDATDMLLLHEHLRALQQPSEFKSLKTNNDRHHFNDCNGTLGASYQNWLDSVRFNHIDWYRNLYNQAIMMNILSPASQQADRSIFSSIGPDLRSCQVMDLTNKQPSSIKHSLLSNIYHH